MNSLLIPTACAGPDSDEEPTSSAGGLIMHLLTNTTQPLLRTELTN